MDIDFKLILEFIWRDFLDKASKASSKKELISWTSLNIKFLLCERQCQVNEIRTIHWEKIFIKDISVIQNIQRTLKTQ